MGTGMGLLASLHQEWTADEDAGLRAELTALGIGAAELDELATSDRMRAAYRADVTMRRDEDVDRVRWHELFDRLAELAILLRTLPRSWILRDMPDGGDEMLRATLLETFDKMAEKYGGQLILGPKEAAALARMLRAVPLDGDRQPG